MRLKLQVQIKMNPKLYVRDPEQSELGRNILTKGVEMIHKLGFENFNFKKLSEEIGTTETGIYRYFENKHRLLIYLITWFWTWTEYQVVFHTNNIEDPREKIHTVIKLFTFQLNNPFIEEHINMNILHQIVISEGDKAYLTKHVTADNNAKLFKPYKDLCHRIATIMLEYNPDYPYPHSLSSTLIETAHHQFYFKDHLPRLTDFGGAKSVKPLYSYLESLVFSSLDGYPSKK